MVCFISPYSAIKKRKPLQHGKENLESVFAAALQSKFKNVAMTSPSSPYSPWH